MDILRIRGVYQPPFNRQKTPSLSGSTNKLHVLILTTNLAACVCAQNLTNFCPHALISNPNVPKNLFA